MSGTPGAWVRVPSERAEQRAVRGQQPFDLPSVCPQQEANKVPGLTAFSRVTTPSIDGSGTTLSLTPEVHQLPAALRRASSRLTQGRPC